MATKELKTKKPKALTIEGPARNATHNVAGGEEKKVKKTSSKKKPSSTGAEKKEDGNVILRIRVRAYESKILDASVKQIIDTAMRYDAEIVGPVPLPTEIKKYTVNRASFIYKNTREQFEIRVHKRLIDIINPNPKTVEALTNLSLPSGVDIDVKML
jgi:small subunit ribosomal protein S10